MSEQEARAREVRSRTTEQAREALQRLIDGVWKHPNKPCFTIPVNEEQDADCILSDVIDERDTLRANVEALTEKVLRYDHEVGTLRAQLAALSETEEAEAERE